MKKIIIRDSIIRKEKKTKKKQKKIEKNCMMMWRFIPHHINLGLIYPCKFLIKTYVM
jgi:hypothetical protein